MTNKIIYLSVSLITFVGLLAIGLNVNLDKAFAQGDKVAVSIVPGSSSLTKNGYQPDPVQVKVGQTVVWTNN
ncbi:MAG TPA: hypothetical protein VFG45_08500, partial [Candidatus Nitrosocosmicus sp.]|nr:hypothetical protein [Candidatus Nitrosocosmicus sp.]